MQLPGLISNCAGIAVDEYDPIGSVSHTVRYKDSDYICRQWCDIISVNNAESIAEYADDYYAGSTAVSKNSFCNGTVYYMGSCFSDDFYMDFFRDLLEDLNIETIKNLPKGVEISIREKDGLKLLFIINLSKDTKEYIIEKNYKGILNPDLSGRVITLSPFAVEIIELID
jgi:beta-galactosidase